MTPRLLETEVEAELLQTAPTDPAMPDEGPAQNQSTMQYPVTADVAEPNPQGDPATDLHQRGESNCPQQRGRFEPITTRLVFVSSSATRWAST